MSIHRVLDLLLDIGRYARYDDISSEPELLPNMTVIQVLDQYRDQIVPYAQKLSSADRIALTKAIAMIEHKVGGRGSVTHVRRLLPIIDDSDRRVFDWILRNSDSYAYWSHGAKSVHEFDSIRDAIAERAVEKAARLHAELQEQLRNRDQNVRDATQRLYNAVRRGDIKAVEALVAKGADLTSTTPDGYSLDTYAQSIGRTAIAEYIRGMLAAINTPDEALQMDASQAVRP